MAYSLGPVVRRVPIKYKSRTYELAHSHEHCALYRNGRLLSVAPPKACPIDDFKEECPFSDCVIEEWVSGETVNLFFDGEWELSTDDGVGGNALVETGDATLRQRFFEACADNSLDLTSLDNKKCYSFVIGAANLWLVACYEIDSANVVRGADSYGELRGTSVCRPAHLIATTYEEATDRFASHNCEAASPGVVFFHIPSGRRSELRNPVYELARIDLKLQHRFFYMRAQDRTTEYLTHFPDHAAIFEQLEAHVRQFTARLHQNYLDCCVKKTTLAPPRHRTHIHSLHQHYLRRLRPSPVTLSTVTEYVSQLNPVKLFYTMNPQLQNR